MTRYNDLVQRQPVTDAAFCGVESNSTRLRLSIAFHGRSFLRGRAYDRPAYSRWAKVGAGYPSRNLLERAVLSYN